MIRRRPDVRFDRRWALDIFDRLEFTRIDQRLAAMATHSVRLNILNDLNNWN